MKAITPETMNFCWRKLFRCPAQLHRIYERASQGKSWDCEHGPKKKKKLLRLEKCLPLFSWLRSEAAVWCFQHHPDAKEPSSRCGTGTPDSTTHFPIMFLHALVPSQILFSLMDHPPSAFVVCRVLTKRMPTNPSTLKNQIFSAQPTQSCLFPHLLSEQVVQPIL